MRKNQKKMMIGNRCNTKTLAAVPDRAGAAAGVVLRYAVFYLGAGRFVLKMDGISIRLPQPPTKGQAYIVPAGTAAGIWFCDVRI